MSRDAREDFLADPGEVADWRLVVLVDAAADAGVLDALPGSPSAVAGRLGLDPHAVRVVLAALGEWGVVQPVGGDGYALGDRHIDDDARHVLRHHARAIRRWSADLPARMRGDEPAARPGRTPAEREQWLQALAVKARRVAPGVVDRCLARFPAAETILDVAGGHGEYGMEFARRGLQVTVQDLPDVVALVEKWPALRHADVQLFGSDVFERLPQGRFDLVLCAGFSHTQPADRVGTLFARLRGVTTARGGIAVQTVLREQRPTGPLFAVQMLVAGGGGDTHGMDEYRAWCMHAGYSPPELVDAGGRALLLAAVAPGGEEARPTGTYTRHVTAAGPRERGRVWPING